MNSAILSMLEKYHCISVRDYENAIKEIIQEIALLGLWRAKFFEKAAFYGGTALRILYGLDRFSEDLDFSLLHADKAFKLAPYLKAIEVELNSLGFSCAVESHHKGIETAIESGFIKAGTKEHLLKIKLPDVVIRRIHHAANLTIKLEVDTDPPAGFMTEVKTLLQPIPFSVRTYQQPDLFAGKIHALLARRWKNRVKGRDYYDFVWYLAHKIPVRIKHLEQRLRQSNHWSSNEPLSHETLLELLEQKFNEVNIESARNDVAPFLRDSQATELWSNAFFIALLPRLKIV